MALMDLVVFAATTAVDFFEGFTIEEVRIQRGYQFFV